MTTAYLSTNPLEFYTVGSNGSVRLFTGEFASFKEEINYCIDLVRNERPIRLLIEDNNNGQLYQKELAKYCGNIKLLRLTRLMIASAAVRVGLDVNTRIEDDKRVIHGLVLVN